MTCKFCFLVGQFCKVYIYKTLILRVSLLIGCRMTCKFCFFVGQFCKVYTYKTLFLVIQFGVLLEKFVVFQHKKNLGFFREAGKGGLLYNPDEEIETKYAWGLGNTFNNQAGALDLWQGLKIASSKGLPQISIIGYSMIIIQRCIKIKQQMYVYFSPTFQQIRMLLNNFESYVFTMLKGRIIGQQTNNPIGEFHQNKGHWSQIMQKLYYVTFHD